MSLRHAAPVPVTLLAFAVVLALSLPLGAAEYTRQPGEPYIDSVEVTKAIDLTKTKQEKPPDPVSKVTLPSNDVDFARWSQDPDNKLSLHVTLTHPEPPDRNHIVRAEYRHTWIGPTDPATDLPKQVFNSGRTLILHDFKVMKGSSGTETRVYNFPPPDTPSTFPKGQVEIKVYVTGEGRNFDDPGVNSRSTRLDTERPGEPTQTPRDTGPIPVGRPLPTPQEAPAPGGGTGIIDWLCPPEHRIPGEMSLLPFGTAAAAGPMGDGSMGGAPMGGGGMDGSGMGGGSDVPMDQPIPEDPTMGDDTWTSGDSAPVPSAPPC